jgi:alkylation response protein AidB-like acyl-CoA dehydrogenase
MDLDLTGAQRIIPDIAAKFIKRELEPIASHLHGSRDRERCYVKEASMAEVHATEATNKAHHDVAKILGNGSCLQEFPAEYFHPDVRVATIYFGTSKIQRLILACALLQ